MWCRKPLQEEKQRWLGTSGIIIIINVQKGGVSTLYKLALKWAIFSRWVDEKDMVHLHMEYYVAK